MNCSIVMLQGFAEQQFLAYLLKMKITVISQLPARAQNLSLLVRPERWKNLNDACLPLIVLFCLWMVIQRELYLLSRSLAKE